MNTNIPICLQGTNLYLVFEYIGESETDLKFDSSLQYKFSQAFQRQSDAEEHLELVKSMSKNYENYNMHKIITHKMSKNPRQIPDSSLLYWKEESKLWIDNQLTMGVSVKEILNSLGLSV